MTCNDYISVYGARENNLRNIDVRIPRNRLTVITGLSGSGKSSLAFDTIYAEGQRRYIETFSAYARGFLGGGRRPDVDNITGLSPVVAIEQKTVTRSPRSTVGTVTEVYDRLRLLFARLATAYSWQTGEPMQRYTTEQVAEMVVNNYAGHAVYLLAPVVTGRKGHYRELLDALRRKGFLQARIDGNITELTEGLHLDRYKVHNIEAVVDKLRATPDAAERLRHSAETAMQQSDGTVIVLDRDNGEAKRYSRRLMCPTTGMCYKDPAPNTFSFNSPDGCCPYCHGIGTVDTDDPLVQVESDNTDEEKERTICPACNGTRLNKEALSYRILGKNIAELADLDLIHLQQWLDSVPSTIKAASNAHAVVAREIVKETHTRLQFMLDVGLGYLALSRPAGTLSGGESQRIRLATQIGSGLTSVTYILDEPSIGLHPRDNARLINSLKQLRDQGNTVIVVEHDAAIMLAADYIIDIGPAAGRNGGQVVFQGTPQQLLKADTLTAPPARGEGATSPAYLTITGCTGNNLRDITAAFPLHRLTVVTGVSGSGKSTLVTDTLLPAISHALYGSHQQPLPYKDIVGLDAIDKVVSVDQSPIGRTPRSCPATYTGVFDLIRALFVALPESRARGYRPARFSFNAGAGRCPACEGSGYQRIEMAFMPDVALPCPICRGRRYNRETLEVRYRGQSIADILAMTVDQATDFFQHLPRIARRIETLQRVGLGYITLGAPAHTLSGGESQRVRLSTELARRDTGRTLYVLDEPTTGLHAADIERLMRVLAALRDKGNTVIIVEHNTDVIHAADHIIDMGPEGGTAGGNIVATGTPQQIADNPDSITGQYL